MSRPRVLCVRDMIDPYWLDGACGSFRVRSALMYVTSFQILIRSQACVPGRHPVRPAFGDGAEQLCVVASVQPIHIRKLGPMPPPARPPWQPEQSKWTKSWRPSPSAVRLPLYGFGEPPSGVGGPGIGPTAVITGGRAAVVPPLGGMRHMPTIRPTSQGRWRSPLSECLSS